MSDSLHRGGVFTVAGSVFFYGVNQGGHTNPTFLVTAHHVISALKSCGVQRIVVRINSKGGINQFLVTQTSDWFFHPSDPSVDVAILECAVPHIADHLVLPSSMSAHVGQFDQFGIEPGMDIIVTGLFSLHAGKAINRPVIRSGTLAAKAEEKVPFNKYGDADAHLIEMHSTGGLSGSPVLAKVPVNSSSNYYLIGLIHGHWEDAVKAKSKVQFESAEVLAMVNTGMATVVPVEKIDEMIDLYSKFPRQREKEILSWSLEKYAPN